MKPKLIVIALVLVIALVSALPVFAAAPCNDADGDGMSSGYEYAQNHIVVLALDQMLGTTHRPGDHMGYSMCVHMDQ